jgi:hypothetical protein
MKTRTLILAAFGGLGGLAAILVRGGREPTAPAHDVNQAAHAAIVRAAGSPPVRRSVGGTMRGVHAAPNTAGSDDVIGSTDPASKEYDPVTLNRVTHITPAEIMNKEPRDPAFAGPREAALRDRISERLRKRVAFETKLDVNCRTSSCELAVQGQSDSDNLNDVLQALDLSTLMDAGQVGPMTSQGASQRKGMSIIMLYSADLRDHAAYDRLLQQHAAHDDLPAETARGAQGGQ